jgi:hypothetical protein
MGQMLSDLRDANQSGSFLSALNGTDGGNDNSKDPALQQQQQRAEVARQLWNYGQAGSVGGDGAPIFSNPTPGDGGGNNAPPTAQQQLWNFGQSGSVGGDGAPIFSMPNAGGSASTGRTSPGLLSMLGQASGNSSIASLLNNPMNYLRSYMTDQFRPDVMTTSALLARQG